MTPVGRHGARRAGGWRDGRAALPLRRAWPSSTTASPPKFAGTGFEVHGTEGSLIGRDVHDPAAGRHGRAAHRGRRARAAARPRRPLRRARSRAFHAAMRGEGAPAATGEDGVWSLATGARASRSGADRPRGRHRYRDSETTDEQASSPPAEAASPDPGRRGRHRLLLERPRLPRRGAGGDRRALRRRRPSAQPDHAPSDRRRRHVRHQGHRPHRQAGPADAHHRRLLSVRPVLGRAAADLADDRRRRRSPPTTCPPASCSTCTARPRPSARAC